MKRFNANGDLLFEKIVNDLTGKIAKKIFKNDDLPSEHNLCEKYSVSRKTVRRALGILKKRGLVEAIPGKGYRITSQNKNSRISKTNTICCLVSRFHFLYSDFCNYLTNYFKNYGFTVLYTFQNRDYNVDPDFFKHQKFDGIVFAGITDDQQIAQVLKWCGNDCPGIVVNHNDCLLPIDIVGTDLYLNTFRGCQYLLDNGHRDIGYIGHDNFQKGTNGFKRCLEINGIEISDKNFIHLSLPVNLAREIESFFQRRTFTAIYVCVYRNFGEVLFNYLQESSIKVPDDISVMGYDDVDITTPQGVVKADCLGTKWQDIAEFAVKRICEKMNSEKSLGFVKHFIESELIIKGSVKKI